MKSRKAMNYLIDKFLKTLSLILLICTMNVDVKATHIVGGELTYKSLGGGRFELRLVIRRDCINGADSVYFDNPAELGVFYTDYQPAYQVGDDGRFTLPFIKEDTLKEGINSSCFVKGNEVCVHEAIYQGIITLPYTEKGYIIAYQRCCRNTILSNIVNPLETGATYSVRITEFEIRNNNSNPQFAPFPPIYICLNKSFKFDHSAIDANGDSLVYSFCRPNIGRTISDPKGFPSRPPYDSVVFSTGYSLNSLLNPNGSGVPLQINPKTGEITGIPNTLGTFLVGVCVTEYKKGVKGSYTIRDFELNVVSCGVVPTADFELISNICDGLTQSFSSKSVNANTLKWFFDFPNNLNASSNSQNPTFTYSTPGIYTIVLVAENGGCTDTLKKTIKVIMDPDLDADYSLNTQCNPDHQILVSNQSKGSNLKTFEWTLSSIGQTDQISTDKDPLFKVDTGGIYTVKLVITDDNGCQDTLVKSIEVNEIKVSLIGDKSICKGDSVRLVDNTNGNYEFKWSPINGLNLSNPKNPLASPDTTTTYTVVISDTVSGCTLEKQITLSILNQIDLDLSGDSVTCDGKINLFARSDSVNIFDWSFDSDFDSIVFRGNSFDTIIKADRTIYVRAGSGECRLVREVKLINNSLNLDYNSIISACLGDSVDIDLKNLNSGDTVDIQWYPDSLFLSGSNTFNPKLISLKSGEFIIYFTVKNQKLCQLEDTIRIQIADTITPDIQVVEECGSLKVLVSTNYKGRIRWDFGDGIGSSVNVKDEYTYTKSGKYIITLNADTVCSRSARFEVNIVQLNQTLKDSVTICPEDALIINIGADSKYKYQWFPDSSFIDPTLPNPELKFKTSGWYKFTFFDQQNPNCSFTDSVYVNIPTGFVLKIDTIPTQVICDRDTLQFTVTSNVDSIIWYDDSGLILGKGKSVIVIVDKDVKITVKAFYFGCELTDSVLLKFVKNPNFQIEGLSNVCVNDTIQLSVKPDISGLIYDWTPKEAIIGASDGSTILVNPSQTTTYTVTIRDTINGCIWQSNSHVVNVSDIQNKIFANAEPPLIIIGAKSQLITIENTKYSYVWEPNDSSLNSTTIFNPIAMPNKTTTYTVTVTDENGCTATASVRVIVNSCEESVFLPTAFSPNGDGKNDTFRIRFIDLKSIELIVYNRWGQELFKSIDINSGWDGTFNGSKLSPDVFGWHLRFTCPDQKSYSRKGNVTLLK
ncbi:MAG: gliding motility-associated C-terminal domain-containing protein [Saprospiraceae bacterium]|nr:gliding motility-associated C-terminal domain-containing protein [Saprospiraceae bacterium]